MVLVRNLTMYCAQGGGHLAQKALLGVERFDLCQGRWGSLTGVSISIFSGGREGFLYVYILGKHN